MNDLPALYTIITLLLILFFAQYDHWHHKVRNKALIAFLPWCLLSVLIPIFHGLAHPILSILDAFLGFLTGGMLLLIISIKTNGGIGGGDIKLTALLGILFGFYGILMVALSASLIALLHMGMKQIHLKRIPQHIPFVPYLFLGSLITMFLQI